MAAGGNLSARAVWRAWARSLLLPVRVAVSRAPKPARGTLGASSSPAGAGMSMSITTEREGDATCVMTIRGILRKADLDRSQQELIGGMGAAATVRLLV